MKSILTPSTVGDPQHHLSKLDEQPCLWRACPNVVVQVEGALFCMTHTIKAQSGLADYYPRAMAQSRITVSGARRPRVTHGEYVYFMRKGDRIKIGYTTNLRQRAYAIQPDEVIGYFPGNRESERRTHRAFEQWALGHEWYRATPECLALIETVLPGAADTAIAA